MRVLFIHSNIAQFREVHRYFCQGDGVDSYLMCSRHAYENNNRQLENLVPYDIARLGFGNCSFYLKKVEEVNQKSLGIHQKLGELLAEGHKFDVIVCHSTAGAPLMLFDQFDIPIVSYIEFPSFRQHGWDDKYPPPIGNRLRDKNFEAISYFSVLKSAHTIVPSEYAKSMFPKELQHKVSVQMEGFDIQNETGGTSALQDKQDNTFYIGFAARDLSSAKGFEKFIEISKALFEVRSDVRFVIIGSEKLLYSYEFCTLDCSGDGRNRSFMECMFEKYEVDRSLYHCLGKLDYDTYSATIYNIDLFLYPVQFSSASWGLFELLGRGRIVIGSDRCFLPEILEHEVNGFLVEYNDTSSWVSLIDTLLNAWGDYAYVGKNAALSMKKYSVKRVAESYMRMLLNVI